MITKKFNLKYLLLLLSILLTSIIYLRTDVMDYTHEHFQHPWDHHKYIWMATNNLDFHIAPFCWRVFVPFLASILPFELSLNFKIIALISVALTGYFVFKIGQKIFGDNVLSISMMIGYFSISYATKYVIYDYWLPDAFAILLMTLGIYFILIKNDLAFLSVMSLGALTKESVLFVLPLYYTLNAEKLFYTKAIKKSAKIFLLPIFIFIGIRILIPAFNSNPDYVQTLPLQLRLVQYDSSEYNLYYILNYVALERIKSFDFKLLYRITIYTFMIHFVLLLIEIYKKPIWLIRFSPFLILVYLQIFFAVNEVRLVSIAFIPVLILSISRMSKCFAKTNYKNYPVLILNIIFFITVVNSGLFYGNWLILRQAFLLVLFYALYWAYIKIKTHFKKNILPK